ncbi:stage III sporulation protein AD [Qiania dongpingensis]|uniref:Stage III sporulation protein AD n=1 Tax=Qiania dongpingensis TaxID=2763669 RepID=A0A7G9G7Z7_9FIRM|nr:stage III sporulation protein AD [Qiania dongpingensis]
MGLIKIAVVGVAAILMAMQLREVKPQFGMYVVFGAGILIFFYAFTKLEGIVEAMGQLGKYVTIEEKYLQILLKMLGISYVSEFAASLCKDSGYNSVAGQIELFGKLSILLISMPVVLSLLKTLGQLLT